ncbi:hypothetical protein B0H11DRAFT_2379160 [Mycena galericulata]|nr:hypothetical protein B0H11DRAFT_2379160 [Mycena galericulata]
MSPEPTSREPPLPAPQRLQDTLPVLDAPKLADFSLNLVDWSGTNVLGVELSSCVYLWTTHNATVNGLCDLSDNDLISSDSTLAVSTSSGRLPSLRTSRSRIPLLRAHVRCLSSPSSSPLPDRSDVVYAGFSTAPFDSNPVNFTRALASVRTSTHAPTSLRLRVSRPHPATPRVRTSPCIPTWAGYRDVHVSPDAGEDAGDIQHGTVRREEGGLVEDEGQENLGRQSTEHEAGRLSGKSENRRLAIKTLLELSISSTGKKGSKLVIPASEFVLESLRTLFNPAPRSGKHTDSSATGRLLGFKPPRLLLRTQWMLPVNGTWSEGRKMDIVYAAQGRTLRIDSNLAPTGVEDERCVHSAREQGFLRLRVQPNRVKGNVALPLTTACLTDNASISHLSAIRLMIKHVAAPKWYEELEELGLGGELVRTLLESLTRDLDL